MSYPDLVIFDCDGVLVDSEIIYCRVDAETLTAHGLPITVEEVVREFSGHVGLDPYATVAARHGRPLPEGIREVARARLMAEMAELPAMAGVADLLERMHHKKCVASNASLDWLTNSLRTTGLYDHFAPHIFSSQMVARGKPAPDLFLHAAERMGVAPERCLVVEDSVPGVTAGVAAGMRVVGFLGGGHIADGHAERLQACGARHIIRHMTELPALVESLG
ncbi:MAG TPA: HAD family hydrolase [Alphaproteobacteria bacterium]|nr:HAD family hydrolase [Alphaproteobacteria bacterium]